MLRLPKCGTLQKGLPAPDGSLPQDWMCHLWGTWPQHARVHEHCVCCMQGERAPRKSLSKKRATPRPAPAEHQLLKMTIKEHHIFALVDSGAPVSLMSKEGYDAIDPDQKSPLPMLTAKLLTGCFSGETRQKLKILCQLSKAQRRVKKNACLPCLTLMNCLPKLVKTSRNGSVRPI